MRQNITFDEYIVLEQNIVKDIVVFFNSERDFNKIIYTEWSAKDVLAHIVMWHESFANNLSAIINKTEPKLLRGLLYEINENGIIEYKNYSIKELLEKLNVAQNIINNNLQKTGEELIPYRKNTKRKYTKEEHIEIVYKHIKEHYNDLIKAYKE
jgi:predicted DNA-binding protein YlxM (UPF0122 family)